MVGTQVARAVEGRFQVALQRSEISVRRSWVASHRQRSCYKRRAGFDLTNPCLDSAELQMSD